MDAVEIAQADRLLTTTKQVRKRLDLTRPVPIDLVLECIQIASAAPIGSNKESNRWLIIDDPEVKAGLSELYSRRMSRYLEEFPEHEPNSAQAKLFDSVRFLVDHLKDVPLLVIPIRLGRVENEGMHVQAGYYGSIMPAVWSFQMAARARGLGSVLTTGHLEWEAEAAELLGLPREGRDAVTPVALLPVAYFTGSDFSPAKRLDAKTITYRNQWMTPLA